MSEKKIAVRLENISKSFIEGEATHQIFNDVSIDIYESKFTVLLGKSGSGKSTLLNLISGLDIPDKGEIKISGENVSKLSDRDRTIFRRNKIGIVFQFFNLIPTLTVLENVTLAQELKGINKKEGLKSAKELLEKVGLANRFNTFPDKLSGGEQQRVAIARALAHNPSLILADEPTGNLDSDTGKIVLDILLNITKEEKKTLIMVTHSNDIVPFADYVYTLQKGKMVQL